MFPFLLALAAPASALPSVERIPPQEAAKRLSQCGLGSVTTMKLTSREDVLVASNAQSATDNQLVCAYKVIGFSYTLELPPNVQRRFDAMLKAKAEVWMKARAHDWLAARGLLDRVPKYQRGVTDDGVFTRQVEALCGPQANGAFQSRYGFHVLNPGWVERKLKPSDTSSDTLTCLINVATAAGFEFGFIGNEYYRR